MASKITSDILESRLYCKYKAWLKFSGQVGSKSEYANLLERSRAEVKQSAIDKIRAQHADSEVVRDVPLTFSLLRREAFFVLNGSNSQAALMQPLRVVYLRHIVASVPSQHGRR